MKKMMSIFILIPICILGASIIASEYKIITSLRMASSEIGFVFGLSLPFCHSFLSYSILKSGYDNLELGLKDKMITNNISTINYFVLTINSVKNEIIWVILLSCIGSWNSYLYPRVILMRSYLRVITLWLFDVSIDTSNNLTHLELQATASHYGINTINYIFLEGDCLK